MEIFGLFPTPLGQAKFDRDLTEEELLFINSLEKSNNQGNLISINKNILDTKELQDVRRFIQENLNSYFQEVYKPKPEDELEIYITISWANYTGASQYHHPHTHPNSFVSGCFYPQVTSGNDSISFERNKYNLIDIEPTEWNLWNSKSWTVGINTGDLLFFPSSLTHFVKEKNQDETRVSIAFNTFVRGKLGLENSATFLELP